MSNKEIVVSSRVTEIVYKKLEKVREVMDIRMSDLIRQILEEYTIGNT